MLNVFASLHLVAAVCFILAIKGLASPKSARTGNMLGILGMFIAVSTSLFVPGVSHQLKIVVLILLGGGIGTYIALRIKMTAMPQLIAGFHSLVGMAAVLIAFCAFLSPESFLIGVVGNIHKLNLLEMSLGLVIGAITFSGSFIAFLKLQNILSGKPVQFPFQHGVNLIMALAILAVTVAFISNSSLTLLFVLAGLSFVIGFLLIIPIGGADMPVVISMLNSYSGWATSSIGFTLQNNLLIITGALVGASGAILSFVMCKAMNRSIFNVIFGGYGTVQENAQGTMDSKEQNIKVGSADDAAFLMANAKSVIIVPGYGMAVAQAQHTVKELLELLQENNVSVSFAIHPVAGRMPGHMNVLLAEANIPYDIVYEQDNINREFAQADVAFVIGANDITNPAAKNDPSSPIYGMPVLEVGNAKAVLFVKRSMSPGYAGVDNELFYHENTFMLFGDAKNVTENILKAIIEL